MLRRFAFFVPFLACGGRVEASTSQVVDAGVEDVAVPVRDARPRETSVDAEIREHKVISRATSSIMESETSLAVAPDGTMAATWIAIGGMKSNIGYAFSRDDGET